MRNGVVQDHDHSMGLAPGPCGGAGYQHAPSVYQQLLPVVRQVLEVVFENENEESTASITQFVESFRFGDNSNITNWMGPRQSEILKGRILEATAHWIQAKSRILDDLIPTAGERQPQDNMGNAGGRNNYMAERLSAFRAQLEQAYYQSPPDEVIAEFIFSVVVDLCGRDAAILGSAMAGMLLHLVSRPGFLLMAEWPSTLLALMVRTLEEMQAKVSKVVMELYNETNFASYDDSKTMLMGFFQYFTVETTTGTLDLHETCEDPAFVESTFRVNLIDSFGCLMKLLYHLEEVSNNGVHGAEATLAVDFEGVKLCRHGALCLVQMTCNDDPTLVYVLDVHLLKGRAFTMQTPHGTSFKGLLEADGIRKVWFDPRNDVDALYHQFGIMPRGIFDLQLAEVADRRSRGLNVNFVQGLNKCLSKCPVLQEGQKVFAERINNLGKSLFEPMNGGNYEIFQMRPLNPVILVYAAHDSRYMLDLYAQYLQSIGEGWVERVLCASADRARWCESPTYVIPTVEVHAF